MRVVIILIVLVPLAWAASLEESSISGEKLGQDKLVEANISKDKVTATKEDTQKEHTMKETVTKDSTNAHIVDKEHLEKEKFDAKDTKVTTGHGDHKEPLDDCHDDGHQYVLLYEYGNGKGQYGNGKGQYGFGNGGQYGYGNGGQYGFGNGGQYGYGNGGQYDFETGGKYNYGTGGQYGFGIGGQYGFGTGGQYNYGNTQYPTQPYTVQPYQPVQPVLPVQPQQPVQPLFPGFATPGYNPGTSLAPPSANANHYQQWTGSLSHNTEEYITILKERLLLIERERAYLMKTLNYLYTMTKSQPPQVGGGIWGGGSWGGGSGMIYNNDYNSQISQCRNDLYNLDLQKFKILEVIRCPHPETAGCSAVRPGSSYGAYGNFGGPSIEGSRYGGRDRPAKFTMEGKYGRSSSY